MQGDDMEQALYQEPTADNIQDFIRVLEDHRRTCEHEQKYVEAEMAKNRIAELKLQDYNRRYEELIFNQTQQREECEQAHIKQYQEFNQQWDEDLLHTQKEDAQALGELEDRHTQEIEQNR
jgi:hypothetical protein